MVRPILKIAETVKNLPDGVEIETFDLGPSFNPRHRVAYLANLRNGEHVHYCDKKVADTIRSSVSRINKLKQQTNPSFYLTIRTVGASDRKGAGFRVLRKDREIAS